MSLRITNLLLDSASLILIGTKNPRLSRILYSAYHNLFQVHQVWYFLKRGLGQSNFERAIQIWRRNNATLSKLSTNMHNGILCVFRETGTVLFNFFKRKSLLKKEKVVVWLAFAESTFWGKFWLGEPGSDVNQEWHHTSKFKRRRRWIAGKISLIFYSRHFKKGACNCGVFFRGQFLWHAKQFPPSGYSTQ